MSSCTGDLFSQVISVSNLPNQKKFDFCTFITKFCCIFKELLKASDENGNGSVDLSQFMALWISFKAKVGEDGDTEADIKTAFREYDKDNDGYITKDEMMGVRKHH